jgi:hypothetical protein
MADGIIDMHDMDTIFSVTDTFGIHRESVSVELTKEDPGLVQAGSNRSLEITIPASLPVEEFAQRLQQELEGMGYVATDPTDSDDDDEDD